MSCASYLGCIQASIEYRYVISGIQIIDLLLNTAFPSIVLHGVHRIDIITIIGFGTSLSVTNGVLEKLECPNISSFSSSGTI